MLLLEIIVFTLKVEDPGLVGKRVMFAYEQCLLCLGHHPDIWLEAALYLQDTAKILQVVHYITFITTLLSLERVPRTKASDVKQESFRSSVILIRSALFIYINIVQSKTHNKQDHDNKNRAKHMKNQL